MIMKKLTKIKLINWHIFNNETLPVKNDVLIFGENGTGKSTLIDGITYVITGGNTTFNTAANINAKRTLEGYVRGKLSIEGKKYLRAGKNVISHIALEFYDEEVNKYFVLGVCLEIRDNSNKVEPKFYHIAEERLKDEYYFDMSETDKYPYSFMVFEKKLSVFDFAYQRIDGSKKEIQSRIERILGLNNKYYELLPKALAFKPIDDVNQFVFDFLLDEDPIDIENVKKSIQSYREIENVIKDEKAKIELLTPIVDNYKVIEETAKEKILYEALLKDRQLKVEKKKVSQYNEKLDDYKKAITKNDSEGDRLDERLIDLKLQKERIENSEGFKIIADKRKSLEIADSDLKSVRAKERNLNDVVLNEQNVIAKLELPFNLLKHLRNKDFKALQSEIRSYREALADLRSTTEGELKTNKEEIEKQNGLKTKLENEYIQLERGVNTYSREVTTLIELIQQQILKEHLVNVEIKPLCELIDIVDEDWRNALEGVLGNKRFDLFIEPRYYDLALRVYHENKEKENITRVGIINVAALREVEIKVNSLATKLKGLKEIARYHINALLGEIICVENFLDLNKHAGAVTKFGMLKQENTVRQINPNVWQKPFIGNSSKKIRLKQLEEEIKEKQEILNNLEKDRVLFEKTLIIIKGESKVDNLGNIEDVWNEIKAIEEEIYQLEIDIKRLESEGFAEQINNLKLIDAEIKTKQLAKSDLRVKNNSLNSEKGRLEGIIETTNKSINQYVAEISMIMQTHNLNEYEQQAFFAKNKEEEEKILAKIKELREVTAQNEGIIINQMATYKQRYPFDAIVHLSAVGEYVSLYRDIKDRNLVELESKASERSKLMNSAFKEDYLSKMRAKIEQANTVVKKLNRVLAKRPFGNKQEIYQFMISRSNDSVFAQYYDIFVSGQEFNVTNLFETSLTLENQQLIEDLLARLVADGSEESQEKKLMKYTDYRNFMSYDIKITNANEEVIYFSKSNREKSGGETQTPFYVIIAASFEQIMKSSGGPRGTSSSATLVILDEAFDKMDESRIEAMVDYFGKLNIQVIISVPPQRAVTIYEYVDTVLVLVNHNNKAIPTLSYRGGLNE